MHCICTAFSSSAEDAVLSATSVTGSEKTTDIAQLRKLFFRRRTEGLRMRYCLNFV